MWSIQLSVPENSGRCVCYLKWPKVVDGGVRERFDRNGHYHYALKSSLFLDISSTVLYSLEWDHIDWMYLPHKILLFQW